MTYRELKDKQQKLLENFIDASEDSYEIEIVERYKQGFKTDVFF